MMAIKSKKSTPRHKTGERILNAPLVKMNLYSIIEQIKSEKTWADSDRNAITIFKTSYLRIVLIGLHEKAELKPHHANGMLSIQVLEGEVIFKTEQESTQIEKGQMIALQENVTHSVIALKESFLLLTLAMKQN